MSKLRRRDWKIAGATGARWTEFVLRRLFSAGLFAEKVSKTREDGAQQGEGSKHMRPTAILAVVAAVEEQSFALRGASPSSQSRK
jgi:hypothetical protein